MVNWTHFIRFVAKEDGQVHLGQIDPKVYPDVGLSSLKAEEIEANLISGSIYDGNVTSKVMTVATVRVGATAYGPF